MGIFFSPTGYKTFIPPPFHYRDLVNSLVKPGYIQFDIGFLLIMPKYL